MAQKGSKTKVKKAARKQAKKLARRLIRRAPLKSKAARKSKAAAKPVRKKVAVKARKAVRPAKKASPRRSKPKTSKPVKRVAPKAPASKAQPAAKPKQAAPVRRMAVPPPATLQRERRRLPEAEADAFSDVREDSRLLSSARAGHDELRSELKKHTEASPAMTAGDVDAKWQDAYALGDEAPGGDNMTPDQDRVDDIGKALGIEYADDEELLGGAELAERDEHRWELDPASKEDDEDL